MWSSSCGCGNATTPSSPRPENRATTREFSPFSPQQHCFASPARDSLGVVGKVADAGKRCCGQDVTARVCSADHPLGIHSRENQAKMLAEKKEQLLRMRERGTL
jgi:hypothetical protein